MSYLACKIPSPGDTVHLQGLASAGHLNGETGTVVRFLQAKMRYQIRVTSTENKETLSIKVENLVVIETQEPPQKNYDGLPAMHVLIPCHVDTEDRIFQLVQCMKSVSLQTDTNACAMVGVSSPHMGLRSIIHGLLCSLNAKRPGIRWYVLVHEQRRSQFEHFRDLLANISDPIDKDAWLMFLDDDDMFHPKRVELFRREAATKFLRDCDRLVFNCGDKLLLDSDTIGENPVQLDEFVLDKGSSEPWKGSDELSVVTELVNGDDVERWDVGEYFDFCMHASILRRFLEITPPQILAHKYCDCRFVMTVGRECVSRYSNSRYKWLLIHFRVPTARKADAFVDADAEEINSKHASVSIETATEGDKELAEETGVPPRQIAAARQELEEQIIAYIARDDLNLEGARNRYENEHNRNVGHGIGTTLWTQVCEKFASYFTDEVARQNREWCKEGRAPWVLLEVEHNDEVY
jgi:hypothetical protein